MQFRARRVYDPVVPGQFAWLYNKTNMARWAIGWSLLDMYPGAGYTTSAPASLWSGALVEKNMGAFQTAIIDTIYDLATIVDAWEVGNVFYVTEQNGATPLTLQYLCDYMSENAHYTRRRIYQSFAAGPLPNRSIWTGHIGGERTQQAGPWDDAAQMLDLFNYVVATIPSYDLRSQYQTVLQRWDTGRSYDTGKTLSQNLDDAWNAAYSSTPDYGSPPPSEATIRQRYGDTIDTYMFDQARVRISLSNLRGSMTRAYCYVNYYAGAELVPDDLEWTVTGGGGTLTGMFTAGEAVINEQHDVTSGWLEMDELENYITISLPVPAVHPFSAPYTDTGEGFSEAYASVGSLGFTVWYEIPAV